MNKYLVDEKFIFRLMESGFIYESRKGIYRGLDKENNRDLIIKLEEGNK